MNRQLLSAFFAFLTFMMLLVPPAFAQNRAECGSIIEGEFVRGDDGPFTYYAVELSAGDQLRVSGETFGDYLRFSIGILNPGGVGGDDTRDVNWKYSLRENPVAESEELSERGTYQIRLRSYDPGFYTLYVACTLRDGTVINPGDTVQPADNPSQPSVAPTFFGTGFPGLPPVDFTNGVTIPFTIGAPNTGSVSPGFEGVFGFTLDVNAGETYTFNFAKVSGNLNLGIAILSTDNQIVFYGGMIASNRLSTDVTFPANGQYTVGVFRVDLLPPDAPEATVFQVTATLQ